MRHKGERIKNVSKVWSNVKQQLGESCCYLWKGGGLDEELIGRLGVKKSRVVFGPF